VLGFVGKVATLAKSAGEHQASLGFLSFVHGLGDRGYDAADFSDKA